MAMETTGSGEELESAELPGLWPLPWPSYNTFADVEGIYFGWSNRAYQLSKQGLLKDTKLARFPLTEEGWAQCWSTLRADYPDLANAVADRTRAELDKRRQRAERRTAEENYEEQLRQIEPLTRVLYAILLGGHGYAEELTPRTEMDLYFTEDGLWATKSGWSTPLIQSAYSDAVSVEFEGPGRITKGGRFLGGGFGLIGAAEGMAIATVLNSISTRSEVRSVIRWEARNMEAFFFTDTATPGDLRIQFSQVVNRIKKSSPVSRDRSDDPLDRLERLAKLHSEGSLTDEEFTAMKRQMIGEG